MADLEKLEKDVSELKAEVHEMKETNIKLGNKIRNINEQLSNTFSIVFQRLRDLEKEVQNKNKAPISNMTSEKDISIPKPTEQLEKIETKRKIVKETTKRNIHQCNQCNFKGKNNVTLNKHMNTKHGDSESHQKRTKSVNDLNCVMCEEKFRYKNDLEEHINGHLEEIKEVDIDSLKIGHDLYECTMCSFESGHNDTIKEHLIKHVLSPKSTEKKDNNKKDDF